MSVPRDSLEALLHPTVLLLFSGLPTPTNLALNKNVHQSSNYQSIYRPTASKAVDGNRDPNFSNGSCSHTWWEYEPFWVVDLGQVYRISHVVITNRGYCTQICTLEQVKYSCTVVQCDVGLTRTIFSEILQTTPHTSPVKARYGMSFVRSMED